MNSKYNIQYKNKIWYKFSCQRNKYLLSHSIVLTFFRKCHINIYSLDNKQNLKGVSDLWFIASRYKICWKHGQKLFCLYISMKQGLFGHC